MELERTLEMIGDIVNRIEGAKRVLKHHLHLRPKGEAHPVSVKGDLT